MTKKNMNISVTGGSANIGNISQGSQNVLEARISSVAPTEDMPSRDTCIDFEVFISYSHQDEAIAKKISAILKQSNIRTFLASDELSAGANFTEEIQSALTSAFELWMIVSKSSLRSEWVITEWGAAWAIGKRIVPILYDCEISDLPERLSTLLCIRLGEIENAIPSLKSRLQGYRKSKI